MAEVHIFDKKRKISTKGQRKLLKIFCTPQKKGEEKRKKGKKSRLERSRWQNDWRTYFAFQRF